MRHNIRKHTFGHLRPAKIQISLRIHAVWSESSPGELWIFKNAFSFFLSFFFFFAHFLGVIARLCYVQSTLVISTSLISNLEVKTWSLFKHKIKQQVIKYCGKEEKLLLWSDFSFFPKYFRYISNSRSAITHSFVKCGCSIYFCLNSVNPICRGTDISEYFRESLGLRYNESRL